ncbi:transcription-repair coupling factor, partial [candidate division KSB1 bacterium]|nr:transcription-repair coupling factor [candidate division KSB1 bacterium]
MRRFSLQGTARAQLSGLVPAAKALYLTLLWQALEQPVLLVTGSNRSAESLFELIAAFFDILAPAQGAPRPLLVPAFDTLPGQDLSPHNELKEQRAVALFRIASREASLVVAPLAGALLRAESPSAYRLLALRLKQGEEMAMDDLAAHLDSIGYERREPVEMEGEYSIRGGIFDVFPAQAHRPVRIEFFGDSIESMRRFDPETQRSVLQVEEVAVLPLEETPRTSQMLRDLAERTRRGASPGGEPFPGWEFAVPLVRPRQHSLEALFDRPVVVWDEPEELRAENEILWKKLEPLRDSAPAPPEQVYFRLGELMASATGRREIELRELGLEGGSRVPETPLEISSRPPVPFRNNMRKAVEDARQLCGQGYRVAFFAASQGEVERLADIFSEHGLPYRLGIERQHGAVPDYLVQRAYLAVDLASVCLAQGLVRRGTILPESRLALIGCEDLFEASDLVSAPGRPRSHLAVFTPESLDLKPGDYVVHAQHGIGRFIGLRQMATGETSEDFMLVEYAGESKLYVPLTRLDLIQKYRGAAEAPPVMDKLGGVTWAKTK